MRRMLTQQSDEFYYVTVMNENYAQPAAPSGAREGILRGVYCLRNSPRGHARVRLLGSGTILREALAAAELLEADFGIASDVYSVTSFTELRREAMELGRAARLGAGRCRRGLSSSCPKMACRSLLRRTTSARCLT